jgi:hypothetical protein
MSARQWFVLSTRAGGAGQLTPGSNRALQGCACFRCGNVRTEEPLDIEVEPEPPDPIMGVIEAVRSGSPDCVVLGLDVPLNFVSRLNAAVVRDDLLEILSSFSHSPWYVGRVSTKTSGRIPSLHTLCAATRLRLRGSARSKINACSGCGRFLYVAMPPVYLLESDVPSEDVSKTESKSTFLISSSVACRLRRERGSDWSSLEVYGVPTRKEPADNLPLRLPGTWDDYEAYERSHGRSAVLPKQPWVPNPRLKSTLGAWDLSYIQTHGIEARFERPDPWQMALMIASYEGTEREASMATLSDWGGRFRQEVDALMHEATAKYKATE